jgi:polyphosphate kinase
MKSRILRLLDNEIKNAKAGKEAWLKMKINHITEPEVTEKLYAASQAGVKIDIVLRGNCSLVPGIPGVSENIHAVGIIDRYLEHARILIFCNGGNPKYYIGSADWMTRNLVNRIEVMAPVLDTDIKADLLRTVEYGLKDTANGRIIDGKGTNQLQPGDMFRSQEELHKAYLEENEQTK